MFFLYFVYMYLFIREDPLSSKQETCIGRVTGSFCCLTNILTLLCVHSPSFLSSVGVASFSYSGLCGGKGTWGWYTYTPAYVPWISRVSGLGEQYLTGRDRNDNCVSDNEFACGAGECIDGKKCPLK